MSAGKPVPITAGVPTNATLGLPFAVAANTAILTATATGAANAGFQAPATGTVFLSIAISAAPVGVDSILNVIRNGTAMEVNVASGALKAGADYAFPFMVATSDVINFNLATATTLSRFVLTYSEKLPEIGPQGGVSSVVVTGTTKVDVVQQEASLAQSGDVGGLGLTLTTGTTRLAQPVDITALGNDIGALGNTLTTGVNRLASGADMTGLGNTLTSGATKSYGRNLTTFTWVDGAQTNNPGIGGTLVSRTVAAGKTGYIYGWQVSLGEANDVNINWTSGGVSKSVRIIFGSRGTTQELFNTAYNEGEAADASTQIQINTVAAGTTLYQARLLYGEL